MYYLGSTTQCLSNKRGQTKTTLRTVCIIVTLYIVINLDSQDGQTDCINVDV